MNPISKKGYCLLVELSMKCLRNFVKNFLNKNFFQEINRSE